MVGAHPADCFDQAGGTLAHHAAQGDQVTAAILTTGVRSHHWKILDEKRREQDSMDVEQKLERAVGEKIDEVREACRILGFDDLRALGLEDDDILLTREMVERIADLMPLPPGARFSPEFRFSKEEYDV
jgi:LmbE family N-acetylglucosaminyl deacetylase